MDWKARSKGFKKYYDYCICGDIEAAICKDGLLFAFDYQDIADKLAKFPRADKSGGGSVWYFNETRDREMGETWIDTDGTVLVMINPSIVYRWFCKEGEILV
jgi:hypothetical protein